MTNDLERIGICAGRSGREAETAEIAEGKETKAKAGEAIPPQMRGPDAVADLKAFLRRSQRRHNAEEVKRFGAVLSYIDGNSASETAKELKTVRSCGNKWIRWYVTAGPEGLLTQDSPGAPPKLADAQLLELAAVITAGPVAAGYTSGVWTGPNAHRLGHIALISQENIPKDHRRCDPPLKWRARGKGGRLRGLTTSPLVHR